MCPIVVPSWPTQGLTASPRTPYSRQPLPLLNAEYCIKLHHDYSSNRFFDTSMTIPTTLVLSSCSQKFASLFAARSSLTRHGALTFLRLRFCSHSINGMLDPKSHSHFIIYPRRDNTSFLQTSRFCFIYSDLPMSSLFIRIERTNEWMQMKRAAMIWAALCAPLSQRMFWLMFVVRFAVYIIMSLFCVFSDHNKWISLD